jgi:hypothetical protein
MYDVTTYGSPTGQDLFRVGDTITVCQSDGNPKSAEIFEVDVDETRVRYGAKWGDKPWQWGYFYGGDVNRWNPR